MIKKSLKTQTKNKELRFLIVISLSLCTVLSQDLVVNASTSVKIGSETAKSPISLVSKVSDNSNTVSKVVSTKQPVLSGGVNALTEKENQRNTLIQEEKNKKKAFESDFLSGKPIDSVLESKSNLESVRYTLSRLKDLGSNVDLSKDLSFDQLVTKNNGTTTSTKSVGTTVKEIPTPVSKSIPSYESLYDSMQDISYTPKKSSQVDTSYDLKSPVKNRFEISSLFGSRLHPVDGVNKMHYGLDLRGTEGTDVLTVWSGTVTKVYYSDAGGNTIEIQHREGLKTRYLHLSSISVYVGQVVNQYDVIGEVGSTGKVTGPHLHFEINVNGTPVDPVYYFGNRGVMALQDYLKRAPQEEYSEIQQLITSVDARTSVIQQVFYGVDPAVGPSSSEPGFSIPRTGAIYDREVTLKQGETPLRVVDGYTTPHPVDDMTDYFRK